MAAKKLIDGVTVVLRGREFVIPPMTFGQIRRNAAHLAKIQASTDLATLPIMAEIIHGAMACNYPDVTPEQLEDDYLDIGNARAVLSAIMGVSGMVAATPGNTTAAD